ncbi:MAG: hypothetical protein ABSC42_14300 [Tepidisphaeraceae bacterium]|jgi:hypothetical protein
MIADKRFLNQPKDFWAHIRSISEGFGYTERGQGTVKVPSISDIVEVLGALGLRTDHLAVNGKATRFSEFLVAYFEHRATVLNDFVRRRLMDAAKAKKVFDALHRKHRPDARDIPMNKQSGDKKTPNYLQGIINILIRANCAGLKCNLTPRSLTTVTRDGKPLRTLARWIDGAFPDTVNPIAVWEVKEHYHTTTFGSRVSGAIYETLLDGMELDELRVNEGIEVKHYLMVDAYKTWWEDGRSYLCRIVDMLHMGLIDEALFGFEVVERTPAIVKQWVRIYKDREAKKPIIARQDGKMPAGGGNEPKPK